MCREDNDVVNRDSEPRGRGRVPLRATKVASRDGMARAMSREEDHAVVNRDSEPRGRGRVPPRAKGRELQQYGVGDVLGGRSRCRGPRFGAEGPGQGPASCDEGREP